ncbi:unnamed protein product, partial [Ectocarpus sp. 4 AP-2014]
MRPCYNHKKRCTATFVNPLRRSRGTSFSACGPHSSSTNTCIPTVVFGTDLGFVEVITGQPNHIKRETDQAIANLYIHLARTQDETRRGTAKHAHNRRVAVSTRWCLDFDTD